MVVSGKKVYLRPICEADTDMVLGWRNSDAVKKYFIFRGEITREQHLSWLHDKVEKGIVAQFIICTAETDTPVGSVYLQNIDPVHKNAEFGIFIGEACALGKGYGTEAASLIVAHGFDALGLHKIYLRVLTDNERAIASYIHAGFAVEGVMKDEIFVDGAFRDVTRMALLKEEDR